MNTILSFINDYSKIVIVTLNYKKNGIDTYLYFTNNKFAGEKSIFRESHSRIFNLIKNDWEIIETNTITGYVVEDIPFEKYNDPSLITDEDLESQKKSIDLKIEKLYSRIDRIVDSFKFLKTYMTEEHYNGRFDIEFEEGIKDKDEYIKNLAYDKATSGYFNYYFLSKKIGVPFEWLKGGDISEDNLNVLKERWKEYLVQFVKYFVNFLYKEIEAITDSDENYKDDLRSLIKEVEEEVDTIHFKDKKTVQEVLSVWPTLIAPAPFFLEDIV